MLSRLEWYRAVLEYILPISALTLPKIVAYIRAATERSGVELELYLEVLFQPLLERIWDLVELVELAHALHCRVVARRARVQPLDDGAHVSKDGGIHQG